MAAKHQCQHPGCSSQLTSKKDLKRHEKTHLTGDKRLESMVKCPHCIKRFQQKSNMVTHMRTVHTKIKDKICPESDCDYATTDPASLVRHRKKRHGYQPKPRNYENVRYKAHRRSAQPSGETLSQPDAVVDARNDISGRRDGFGTLYRGISFSWMKADLADGNNTVLEAPEMPVVDLPAGTQGRRGLHRVPSLQFNLEADATEMRAENKRSDNDLSRPDHLFDFTSPPSLANAQNGCDYVGDSNLLGTPNDGDVNWGSRGCYQRSNTPSFQGFTQPSSLSPSYEGQANFYYAGTFSGDDRYTDVPWNVPGSSSYSGMHGGQYDTTAMAAETYPAPYYESRSAGEIVGFSSYTSDGSGSYAANGLSGQFSYDLDNLNNFRASFYANHQNDRNSPRDDTTYGQTFNNDFSFR